MVVFNAQTFFLEMDDAYYKDMLMDLLTDQLSAALHLGINQFAVVFDGPITERMSARELKKLERRRGSALPKSSDLRVRYV
jgi:hypothetical protein